MSRWLEEAVRVSHLPPSSVFPRPLADEVETFLPVSLVFIPALTCHLVRDWLSQWNIPVDVPDKDRPVHGLMVERRSRAFIFCDERDSAEVQRFTIAHEVAHFILDYLLPRARALDALGEGILLVLNGESPLKVRQGFSAMLKRIPLGTQVRLLERGPSGAICSGKVDASEHRADRLAFELLAPAAQALPVLQGLSRREGESELASRFGLGLSEARSYVRVLLGPEHRPFSIQKYFSEEEEA